MIDGIREHGHGRHDRHLVRASYFDDEMGEGWLVVASQAVRDAMQSQLCTLNTWFMSKAVFTMKESGCSATCMQNRS
jgi:hypothetical protein